jgi:hypothetical protein
MRLSLVPVPRLTPALLVIGGTFAVVGGASLALHGLGAEVTLCRFRALTGLPCPTCGATRGAAALLRGDVGEAFAMNPLLMLVAAAVAVLLLARLVAGVGPALSTRPGEGRWLFAGALLLVLLDWAYLVAAGR